MRKAARNQDQHGLLVHDARFHELVVEAAGNSVLLDAWSGLRIEAFTLVSVITSHLDLVAIANTHLPILDALRQGDGDMTGKVMREHINTFGDLLTGDQP
jgi:DNA-binding GntR family transcriptional regulator